MGGCEMNEKMYTVEELSNGVWKRHYTAMTEAEADELVASELEGYARKVEYN
jgi:hypothetical protein